MRKESMNPYKILDVEEAASAEDIKRAYREKAKEAHPDAGGTNGDFQKLSAAYTLLSDPKARERYDRTGSTAPKPNVREQAKTKLASLMIQTIERHAKMATDESSPICWDLKGEILAALHGERDGNKAKLDNVRKSLKYVRRIEAKLKRGDGFLNAVLLEQAKGMEGLIESIQTELSIIKKAMGIIERYKFEPDKEGPAISRGIYDLGTFSFKITGSTY